MWIRLLLLYNICVITHVFCHIPNYISTPPSRIDQFCQMAETCVHDTIPICGRMGEETRTFMDLCDLLEYACDTNHVYVHIDDIQGCPRLKEKP